MHVRACVCVCVCVRACTHGFVDVKHCPQAPSHTVINMPGTFYHVISTGSVECYDFAALHAIRFTSQHYHCE